MKPDSRAGETANGDGARRPGERDGAAILRRTLERVLRKRVKRFVALVPSVLAGGGPEAVHDARVSSRRMQQAVSAFFPKPRSGKVQQLRQTPRRVRRALGGWRNCDVLLDLVERRQQRSRGEAKRGSWELVRAYLLEKRTAEIARARKKLLRQDPVEYADIARRVLDHLSAVGADAFRTRLFHSVQDAWRKWRSALSRAQDTRAVADLHALRIATKDLRYRTELLHDVGLEQLKAELAWLTELQGALGAWHDRQLLRQAVAEAVGRADILLNELPRARILLAELDADGRRPSTDVARIFRVALEHPGFARMERRIATYEALAPDSPAAATEGGGDETRKGEVNA